jgi:hypothetical protein
MLRRFIGLLSSCGLVWSALAQYDARQLPLFLQAGFEKQPPAWGRIRWVNPADYRPEELSKPSDAARLLYSPTGIPLVNIAPYSMDQSETWITLHHRNPQLLLAGANDSRYNYGGNYRMVSYRSTDGGRTWSAALTPRNELIPTAGGAAIADPGLAFDNAGNAYYGHIMAQVSGSQLGGTNGVFLAISTDGGATWSELSPVTYNAGQNVPFDDKCLIAVDTVSSSPYRGTIYVVWRRFGGVPGIYIARSTDGGNSWSVPTLLSSGGGDVQAPMVTVGPNGEVYVAWRQELAGMTSAMVQISLNGGQTWRPAPVIAQTVGTTGTYNSTSGRQVLADKQNIRVSSYPAIAVDHSNTPRRGWIYLVQSGKDVQGRSGIFFTYSTNGGLTWAPSQRIDNNTLHNDLFFPAIAVDPLTGIIAVLYYSSQHDPDNRGVDAYLAISRDAQTWRHIRLTPWTFYIDGPEDVSYQGPGNYYWGDYTGITAYGGRIYPCFWMPNAPRGSYSTLDVYVALVSTAPQPPQALTVESTPPLPSGTVRLRWRDPELNLLGEPLEEFSIRIFRDGQLRATVPKGTQEFTESGLPDGATFTYELVAVTPEGMESEPARISGIVGGALEPLPPSALVARPHEQGILLSWQTPAFHVDSTPLYDLAAVYVYNADNGALLDSLRIPALQAGTPAQLLLRVPIGRFYQLYLRALSERGNRRALSQSSDTVLAYAGAPLQQLLATFDDSASTPAFYTDGTWGLTSRAAASPPNSLTDSPDGFYPNRSNTWVVLAPVVVSAAAPTLSYEHIALVEPGDTAVTEVSRDFGQSWVIVQAVDIRRSAGFRDSVENSSWFSEHRDLRAFIGDTIYIRFRLRSNLVRNNDGWYIDNVRLDTAEPDAVPLAATPRWRLLPQPATERLLLELPAEAALEPPQLFSVLGERLEIALLGSEQRGELRVLIYDVSRLPSGLYLLRNRTVAIPVLIVR